MTQPTEMPPCPKCGRNSHVSPNVIAGREPYFCVVCDQWFSPVYANPVEPTDLGPILSTDHAAEIWLRLEARKWEENLLYLTPDEQALYDLLTKRLTHAANILSVTATEVEA